MKLRELIMELDALVKDITNLDKEVEVTGCYASVGDIGRIYYDKIDDIIVMESDICSG